VYAKDWGLTLRLPQEVSLEAPRRITHIGIRAHDFVPVSGDADPKGHNRVRINVTKRSESPFEHIVLFTNADAPGPESQQEFWWLYSKYGDSIIPEWLFIPPEAILLLGEDTP
jgi:molybdate transport system ATP-binding protein